jgi:hypothetical protein
MHRSESSSFEAGWDIAGQVVGNRRWFLAGLSGAQGAGQSLKKNRNAALIQLEEQQ